MAKVEIAPSHRMDCIKEYYFSKKNREIAARLGISTTAVEKHIAKALRHLSLRLGREQLFLALLVFPTDLLQLFEVGTSNLWRL